VRAIALYEAAGRVEDLLYYTRGNDVYEKNRGERSSGDVLASEQTQAEPLAADDAWVYWGTGDFAIRRQAKGASRDGGALAPQTLHVSRDRVGVVALAVDDQRVFWLDQRGRVFSKEKAPSPSAETELAQSESTTTGSLVVAGERIVWANVERGTVSAIPKQGGAKIVLAVQQPEMRGLAVDLFETPPRVYWATNGSIARVELR